MLVLDRTEGEAIVLIDRETQRRLARIVINDLHGRRPKRASVGIDAPNDVEILREELITWERGDA